MLTANNFRNEWIVKSSLAIFLQRIEKGLKKVYYSLYGVVSHSGDLSSGHYVAYIRSRCPSSQTEKFFYEAANLPLPSSFAPCSAADLKELVILS